MKHIRVVIAILAIFLFVFLCYFGTGLLMGASLASAAAGALGLTAFVAVMFVGGLGVIFLWVWMLHGNDRL